MDSISLGAKDAQLHPKIHSQGKRQVYACENDPLVKQQNKTRPAQLRVRKPIIIIIDNVNSLVSPYNQLARSSSF